MDKMERFIYKLSTQEYNLMSEEQDADLAQFDLALKRKKKKVKSQLVLIHEEKEPEQEQEQEQEEEHDYVMLLDRLYRLLREEHPNLVSRKKTVIPVPIIAGMGSKKSMWVNFASMLQTIHRPSEHVQAYMISELNSACSIDSNNRLLMRGKFNSKNIQSIMQKYITEYVACHMCRGSDTLLMKDVVTRIYFMNCEACGSSRSVPPIKNGYSH